MTVFCLDLRGAPLRADHSGLLGIYYVLADGMKVFCEVQDCGRGWKGWRIGSQLNSVSAAEGDQKYIRNSA